MTRRPQVLWIGSLPDREQKARSALANVDLRSHHPGDGPATAAVTNADLVLIDFQPDVDGALQLFEELHRAAPTVPLVAVGAAKDPDLIVRAVRAGACDFALLDPPGELVRVVAERLRRTGASTAVGTIVAVFPSKGGTGTTTIATNLAGALASNAHRGDSRERAPRVVVVDLDLALGDVQVFLDLSSSYSIVDVLHNMTRLDRDLLLASVPRHASGMYVLSQTDRMEDADRVTPADVKQLLQFLAHHFDYVICDGLRGFDDLALAALDTANHVMLVLTQDVPAIKNAQRCLGVFARLGYGHEKVRLVVNRQARSERIDLQAIADNLRYPISASVANDYPTVIKAINQGALLRDVAPRARVTQDITRVALLLTGPTVKPRPGLLRSLFGSRTDVAPERVDPGTSEEQGEQREPERAAEAT